MIAQEKLNNVRLFVGDAMDIKSLKQQTKGVDCAATFFVLHELCDNDSNPRTLQFLSAFRASFTRSALPRGGNDPTDPATDAQTSGPCGRVLPLP